MLQSQEVLRAGPGRNRSIKVPARMSARPCWRDLRALTWSRFLAATSVRSGE
jgi:hypothetical protein